MTFKEWVGSEWRYLNDSFAITMTGGHNPNITTDPSTIKIFSNLYKKPELRLQPYTGITISFVKKLSN
jgi:hypothetical protein